VACVIWLHGLGADGHDFESIVPMLNLPDDTPVRFIFPHAPVRPITVNGGMVMRGWYDIRSIGINENEDSAGIRQSAAMLKNLIDAQVAQGMPASSIVVAGFSQGGAIALFQGLRHPVRLAGILALSSYLPMPNALDAEISNQVSGMPVFMGHGEQDLIVPMWLGEETRRVIRAHQLDVQWNSYPMAHSVCQEEISDIGSWLVTSLRNPVRPAF
jgi:phospholipase/carboxylesterase